MSPQTDKPNLLALLNTLMQKHDIFGYVTEDVIAKHYKDFVSAPRIDIMLDMIFYAYQIKTRCSNALHLKNVIISNFDLIHIYTEIHEVGEFNQYADDYRELIRQIVNQYSEAIDNFVTTHFCW